MPEFTAVGVYTVSYTISRDSYNDVTGQYTFTIEKGDITGYEIKANDTVKYDGAAKVSATVTVGVPADAKITYTCGTDAFTEVPSFTEVGTYDVSYTVSKEHYNDATGLVSKVYKGANGYALEVLPSGFDNTITMMVGVDNEGKVLGISVVSHTETAGLGAVAAAGTPAGENFRGQFVGASGSVSVTKDGGTMDAITGATITSRAVCAGVNAALECVAQMG